MKKIFFFSNNINKINEIQNIVSKKKIKVLSILDFEFLKEPIENGISFSENAKIKSYFGYKKTLLPTFADDSGICIEALNWKPGIHSKKFLNNFKKMDECFNYIINKANMKSKYKAFFKTSICLTLKESYHIVFEGRVNGTISEKPIGKNGFGYDPIFIPSENNRTYGEMTKKEKNSFSHRSIAINKLLDFLN